MDDIKFDIQRAILPEADDLYEPLYVSEPTSLKDALQRGLVNSNGAAQLFQFNEATYVFGLDEMIYYHVAQIKGEPPLMLTHCLVCNGGACFSPVIDGVYHHFYAAGLYDSMTILKDEETGSIWHHITGVCLHGPLEGTQLESYGTAMTTTFGQALQIDPEAKLVSQPLDEEQTAWLEEDRAVFSGDNPSGWDEYLAPSILQEDERLSRMNLGLGVWADNDPCFYPTHTLHDHQNILFDTLAGRRIAIFISGNPGFPRAIYTDAEVVDIVRGEQFRLSNGWTIRDGLVYDSSGSIITPEHPRQIFARWFGFSLSFPNCRIYGGRS